MEILSQGKFPLPIDRERVAADWAARGYSCGLFVDPPGRAWTGFVHRSNELVTVVEGRLRMTVGDQSYEGFIPRQAVQSVVNIHGGTTRWLYGYD